MLATGYSWLLGTWKGVRAASRCMGNVICMLDIFLYWLAPETVIFLTVYKCTIRISFPFLAVVITFTDGIVLLLLLDSVTHECTQTGWHLLTQTQSEWLITGHIGRPWAGEHFPRGPFPPCHPCSHGWWDPGAMWKVQQEQSCWVSVPLKRTKKGTRNENFKWLLSRLHGEDSDTRHEVCVNCLPKRRGGLRSRHYTLTSHPEALASIPRTQREGMWWKDTISWCAKRGRKCFLFFKKGHS